MANAVNSESPRMFSENRELQKSLQSVSRALERASAIGRVRLEKLGQGVSGTVYLLPSIYEKKCGTAVVLKLFRKELAHCCKSEARFLQTVQKCSRFPKIYYKGKLSVIMEYVSKDLYHTYLNPKTHLSHKDLQIITIQLLEALDFLFSKEIVHADIKPENISYGNGQTKLLDFGLSFLVSKDQPQLIQSLYYRCPECISEQKHFDSEADVWSLGCVLFELCTGEVLIKNKDARHGKRSQADIFLEEAIPVLGMPPKDFVKESQNPDFNEKYEYLKSHPEALKDLVEGKKKSAGKNSLSIRDQIKEAGLKANYPKKFISEFTELVEGMVKWNRVDRSKPSESLALALACWEIDRVTDGLEKAPKELKSDYFSKPFASKSSNLLAGGQQ